MEYLIINSNKIKIKMSAADMKKYGISAKDAGSDSPRLRRVFWRVLDEAHKECGFSVLGERVLIQIYPSEDYAEVFVTKLGRMGSSIEKSISRSDNVTMLSSRLAIYKFGSIELLVAASKKIPKEAREGRSEVYVYEDGAYYLILEERGGRGAPSEISVLGEFAQEVPTTLIPYIREHSATVVKENALAVLSEL